MRGRAMTRTPVGGTDVQAAASAPERRAPAVGRGTVLFAGEFRGTSAEELILALDGLAPRCTSLTVAVVAVPTRVPGPCVPFVGCVAVEQSRREVMHEAACRACRLATLAPPVLRVEHLAVAGWSELARHAARRGYDAVVIAEPPSRRGDRRLVRRAGWWPLDLRGAQA